MGAATALAVGLVATGALWRQARADEALKFRSNFEYRVLDAQDRIARRLATMEQMLWGVRALFSSSEEMDRQEFREYVEMLDLPRYSPGIQALGFVKHLEGPELEVFEARVRRSMPAYEVWPPGRRPEHAPIMFIAPIEGRNLEALGFDMFSEPVRRAALVRARDEATAALAGKVRLVQEPAGEDQAGSLLFVPVFAEGPAPLTVGERRLRLEGWAYLAFRMGELMRSTLDGRNEIATRIYDGETPAPEALLFDSAAGEPPTPERRGLTARQTLSSAGRTWTLVMEAKPAFGQTFASRTPEVIASLGAILTLLLSGFVYVVMGGRARAESRARQMNRELIEAHAAVEESEQRLQLAMQGAGLASWDYAAPGDRVVVSERFCEMLGLAAPCPVWRAEELLSFAHPDDLPTIRAAIDAHLAGATPSDKVELRARRQDGSWVWLLLAGQVVARGPDGKPQRAAGTIMDLTERKRAEEERAHLVERYHRAQRAASMGTLASGMAHEINNPLSVVISSVSYARLELGELRDGPVLDEVKEALDDAADAAHRVRALVADLNAFTDAQHDANARAELPRVLQRALEHTRLLHTERASIDLALPPLPPVVGAEPELVQLFVSLLTNALQATGEAPNHVRVAAEHLDGQVRVRVVDQGVGMPEELVARVFDPFFTTRQPGQGKGLGLSTALSIVRSVGGNLELDSVPGRGTTAVVTLVEASGEQRAAPN